MFLLACTGGAVDTAPVQVDDTGPPRGAEQFALPLADPSQFDTLVGMDHDPAVYSGAEQLICLDRAERTWPHCYDEHDGSDYLLTGSWDAMAAGSVEVLAAADGVVTSIEDGNYDLCHGDPTTLENSCDGHEMIANHVIVEHPSGATSMYWHLMEGSVAVQVGDEVACGDVLGKVGSSGNSSQPHLHFEVQVDGEAIDPYAGPLSQEETWWIEQGHEDALPSAACP